MTAPIDPKALHEKDWSGTKSSDSFYAGSPRYPEMAAIIAGLEPRRLLDVGCGSGYLASLIGALRPGVHMDGMDISEVALRRAAIHFKRVWQVNLDSAPLPAETGAYDTAVCVEVLEHLYDPAHTLEGIRRCLSSSGRLVATVPNLAFWRYRLDLLIGRIPLAVSDPRHLHAFTVKAFTDLLNFCGFSVVGMSGHGVRLSFLARVWPGMFSDILIVVAEKK